MTRTSAVVALALMGLAVSGCGGGGTRVTVAAGTTLVDSGVIDQLAEAYENSQPGVEISVVGRATREVLDLGGRGAADILISHAPKQENEFLEDHPGAIAYPLFSSRFLLVGPAGLSMELDGKSAVTAFREVATREWAFVTRADGSGTYEAESALWAAAGLSPGGAAWYSETGQGMGLSLQVADQTEAFILVEEGTFLAARDALRLRPVDFLEEPLLENPYTVIIPNAQVLPGEFVAWLLSDAGRIELAAANSRLFGSDVFAPPASG